MAYCRTVLAGGVGGACHIHDDFRTGLRQKGILTYIASGTDAVSRPADKINMDYFGKNYGHFPPGYATISAVKTAIETETALRLFEPSKWKCIRK